LSDPQHVPQDDPQRLLRLSLGGNAGFSFLSGMAFVLASSPLALAIGWTTSWVLVVLGVGLLGFSAGLGWLCSRETIPLAPAKVIVWCDAAWVAATIPFVFMVEMSRMGVGRDCYCLCGAWVFGRPVSGYSSVSPVGFS
jgi:hypothetical protein